ncbi:SHOCT domain-containing protein [Gandjariella thermophila]|uniref:SHOCT domain-containing protein n=1 Tax=Gandjariella thermophila TaxID=1931992 RepID=A0A4D4J3A7_9PSEU|nr:SHOCT domain-containing protein [Gandjariella thermophila]GDY31155.1 hypothetical protein GTS_27880 [Gandjariella thermophila]
MTWQDQLRQLDQELAAGKISADDYRRRRDELLAEAQREQDQAQPPAESGEGRPQGQQGPFPPPFKWEASTPETTQVMQPVQDQGEDGSADATQVVRDEGGPADTTQRVDPSAGPTQRVDPSSGPTQVVNPGAPQDPERTQVVRGPGTGPFPQQQFPQFPGQPGVQGGPQFSGQQQGYPGQQMPRQQGGWPQRGQEDVAPPWASSDFPPLDSGESWVKQGPEVFDDGGGRNVGKIVGVAAAVVLLLAVAFGAYWIWGRGSTGGAQAASSAPAPATTTTKPKDPTDIADLGGSKEDYSAIKTFADIQSRVPYLTSDEQQLYQSAGAGKAQFAVSRLKDGATVIVLTVQAGDKQSAQTAAQSLGQLQTTYGMQPVPNAPTGVVATQIAASGQNPAKLRAHYASQGVIIRVEVAGGGNGPGMDTLTKDFEDALGKQLRLSPANA